MSLDRRVTRNSSSSANISKYKAQATSTKPKRTARTTERKISEFMLETAPDTESITETMAENSVKPTTSATSPGRKVKEDVTTTELKELIMSLKHSMEESFSTLSTDMKNLTGRVAENEKRTDEHETKIGALQKEVVDITDTLNELTTGAMSHTDNTSADGGQLAHLIQRIQFLEKREMENAIYARKYNLLVYGLSGNEKDFELTEIKIREFMKTSLQLGETSSQSFPLVSCHRLPNNNMSKRQEPDPVIVKFVTWSDREQFLQSAKNIPKDSGMRIRTHLPPEMAKERGVLASKAYHLRQQGQHARIRERGSNIWLESRSDVGDEWKRHETMNINEILDSRNKKLYLQIDK